MYFEEVEIYLADRLTEEQIKSELINLPGWMFERGSIKKTFITKHYPATMAFVAAVGGFCQKRNHHPDYVLMKYKEVEVSFSTHSAGGVTMNDIEAAKDIEKIPI